MNSKIKLGLIGCGGRGVWIAGLFAAHGGYDVFAASDYFPDRTEALGTKLSVARERLFPGLSGYRRVWNRVWRPRPSNRRPIFIRARRPRLWRRAARLSGQASGRGCPGCRTIAECGRGATAKRRAFLVDFQTRAHPASSRRSGASTGAPSASSSSGSGLSRGKPLEQYSDLLSDNPKDPEVRLRAWGLDRALSGDIITEQEIHALDVADWIMGEPPLWAVEQADSRPGPRSAPAGTISSSIISIQKTWPSSSAAASSKATARPKASKTGCSEQRHPGDRIRRDSGHPGGEFLQRRPHRRDLRIRGRCQHRRFP